MDNSRYIKTAKFGGTSLADASQYRKVANIIRNDPSRRCIVVSAPGKRNPQDYKITDLLYRWTQVLGSVNRAKIFTEIRARFKEIVTDLGLPFSIIEKELDAIEMNSLTKVGSEDFAASRGEHLSALIMSALIGYKFVDAKDFIRFNSDGTLNLAETKRLAVSLGLRELAEEHGIVVPGFYGLMPNGTIKTFSRGGSDITGSIVAACTDSRLYENWTDVSGVLMADPKIVSNPKRIDNLTYGELRELAYMGANVLHEEAVFPVREMGIAINIRNTNDPLGGNTLIESQIIDPSHRIPGSIIGIAGKKNFSVIRIEKPFMNQEVGFIRRLCDVMERFNVCIEHMPSGIDTISVIVKSLEIRAKESELIDSLWSTLSPENITVQHGMAMICTVGSAMVHTPGVAARLFKAVSEATVNVSMINQGSSEINIIIGVSNEDFEKAIRAIYGAFVN